MFRERVKGNFNGCKVVGEGWLVKERDEGVEIMIREVDKGVFVVNVFEESVWWVELFFEDGRGFGVFEVGVWRMGEFD